MAQVNGWIFDVPARTVLGGNDNLVSTHAELRYPACSALRGRLGCRSRRPTCANVSMHSRKRTTRTRGPRPASSGPYPAPRATRSERRPASMSRLGRIACYAANAGLLDGLRYVGLEHKFRLLARLEAQCRERARARSSPFRGQESAGGPLGRVPKGKAPTWRDAGAMSGVPPRSGRPFAPG